MLRESVYAPSLGDIGHGCASADQTSHTSVGFSASSTVQHAEAFHYILLLFPVVGPVARTYVPGWKPQLESLLPCFPFAGFGLTPAHVPVLLTGICFPSFSVPQVGEENLISCWTWRSASTCLPVWQVAVT